MIELTDFYDKQPVYIDQKCITAISKSSDITLVHVGDSIFYVIERPDDIFKTINIKPNLVRSCETCKRKDLKHSDTCIHCKYDTRENLSYFKSINMED